MGGLPANVAVKVPCSVKVDVAVKVGVSLDQRCIARPSCSAPEHDDLLIGTAAGEHLLIAGDCDGDDGVSHCLHNLAGCVRLHDGMSECVAL